MLELHRMAPEWAALSAELVALGPHRLRIALHVAHRAAISREISDGMEDWIVARFGVLVEDAIALTGGIISRADGGETNPAAAAIWQLLALDGACPAMAEVAAVMLVAFVIAVVVMFALRGAWR